MLGAFAPSLPARSRPPDAAHVAVAHVERDASVTRADRHEGHATAPCHAGEAPSPERSDPGPILAARCPCGCGGLPGSVSGHAGSGPALLASAPALDVTPTRGTLAPSVHRLPAPLPRSVDHVPLSA
jgi:hypothetical protein